MGVLMVWYQGGSGGGGGGGERMSGGGGNRGQDRHALEHTSDHFRHLLGIFDVLVGGSPTTAATSRITEAAVDGVATYAGYAGRHVWWELL